jgi:dTDP-4-amino-4,6-dideoxygalactose transaminase
VNQPVQPPPLPFIDLGAQRRRLGSRVDEAILRVLDHGAYIMGPEVKALEADLAAFCGAKHVISCGNGTDALALVLMAKDVRPGHAILCPSFTFAATAEVVAWLGATPVFVDVDETTFNLDVTSLAAAIRTARERGLDPIGLITVDLFGQPADYDAIAPICEREGLWMLCDAAQSFGASYKGRRLGAFGLATTTSFFPAKPLGCYGDGGAIFTEDGDLADILRSLRVHGQGEDKYDNVRIGMNGRLDTVQAAVLIEKLRIFEDEIVTRNVVADRYREGLADVVRTPEVAPGNVSTWAQYTIRVPAGRRDALAADLKAAGIPTAIYYPKPLHQQTAYKHYPVGGNGLPVSDLLASEVISLPMHPYLDEPTQDRVIAAVRKALAGTK